MPVPPPPPDPCPERPCPAAPDPDPRPFWTGEELVAALRRGDEIGDRFSNRQISGEVNLTGVSYPHRLTITNTRFHGRVIGDDARFGNTVDFTGCRFEQGLSLNQARIAGALVLVRVQCRPLPFVSRGGGHYDFVALWQTRIGQVLDLDGFQTGAESGKQSRVFAMEAQIDGRVSLIGAVIRGDLFLNFAFVRHPIFAGAGGGRTDAAWITGHLQCHRANTGSVLLSGVRIGGDLDLSRAIVRGGVLTVYSRRPKRPRAPLAGPADSASPLQTRLGSTLLSQMRVTGYVNLSGATINGDFDLEAAQVAGSVILQRTTEGAAETRVAYNLMLSGASVGVNVELQGLRIGGELDLRNARIRGDLLAKQFEEYESPLGPPTEVGAGTFLDGLTVNGVTSFEGASCKGPFRAIHATFDDGLRCDKLTHELGGYPLRPAEGDRPQERPEFDLSYARVNALLSLNGARMREDVQLHAVQVKGSITAEKAVLAKNLAAVRAVVVGSVALAGIEITGRLNLANADIGANLELDAIATPTTVHAGAGANTPDSGADPKVAVNLEFIRVRGQCVLLRPGGVGPENRVAIGHAQFGSLTFVGSGFPAMSANGFGFRQLELDPAVTDELALALGFLARTEPFQKSTYRMIERYYRDRGEDRIADRIFREMKREEEAEERQPWAGGRAARAIGAAWWGLGRGFRGLVLDLLVGYGTASHRLLFVLLGIFVLMTWMFHNPQSVSRSFTPSSWEMVLWPKAADEDHHPDTVMKDRQWRCSDAIAMSVRTTIPLVPLVAEKDWEPSTKPLPLVADEPKWLQEWVSYQNVAGAVQFLCYILVPLFLASASGWLKRRGD